MQDIATVSHLLEDIGKQPAAQGQGVAGVAGQADGGLDRGQDQHRPEARTSRPQADVRGTGPIAAP
jgi:hypothetical protein